MRSLAKFSLSPLQLPLLFAPAFPLSIRLGIKDLKKKKKEEEKKKTAEATTEPKKKEKRVFDLPGQKRDPPEERDPLMIFYKTLYEQIPHSEMAQFW
ncbi:hypothetical protein FEM48_Zijuj09G0202800 [Ziziphus jujuba var. spinosa]|uniref:Uncharacterized protein n=1 Tax=Ziziphus jujuba var. spinosa TaxID=714518 RepID=A0A978UV37_ZIZJJ|nr:hypothetical protein FEM48_Zijuj09G0202800 [Ziziphus jujuba var. spinosa]